MATICEVQECSRLAGEIISNLFEAESAVERYRRSQSETLARDFVVILYKIENDSEELSALLCKCGEVFSGGYTSAVELWPPAAESAIYAVCRLGEVTAGHTAFAVVKKALPNLYKAGREYPLPQLVQERDMLSHVEAAMQGFFSEWPGHDALNRAIAMVRQEVARALRLCPSDSPHVSPANSVTVALDRGVITVDGQEYPAEAHWCAVVQALIDEGGRNLTGPRLHELHGCAGKNWTREFSALKDAIPGLADRIKSDGRRGYRIVNF